MLYTLEHTIMSAAVFHPDERTKAVEALLSGRATAQQVVYANLDPAVTRFGEIDAADQVKFSDALATYVRAYAFLAQVMPWTERDLEELYLYGKALLPLLPRNPGDPLPQISDSVLLTHLRTEAIGIEANLGLTPSPVGPGQALTGAGKGKQVEQPKDLLSVIIGNMNEAFGLNLTKADRIWFEQQRQAVLQDEETRVVALHNDFDQFLVHLEKKATDMIVDRHESNGMLFNAYFEKPGVREQLLKFLATAYDEIRKEARVPLWTVQSFCRGESVVCAQVPAECSGEGSRYDDCVGHQGHGWSGARCRQCLDDK